MRLGVTTLELSPRATAQLTVIMRYGRCWALACPRLRQVYSTLIFCRFGTLWRLVRARAAERNLPALQIAILPDRCGGVRLSGPPIRLLTQSGS